MNPNDIDGLLVQAVRHHELGELGRAETHYRHILAIQPKHADALHLLGLLAYQAGQFDESVRLIQEAVSQFPRSAAFLSNYGEVLRSVGRVDEAIDVLRLAVNIEPHVAKHHHNLSIAYHHAKQLDAALDEARWTVNIDPTWPEARKNLVQILSRLRRFEEALEHSYELSRQVPDDAEVWQKLGGLLNESGKHSEAKLALQRSLALDNQTALTWNEYGSVCLKLLETEEAGLAFAEAIRLQPDFDWPYNNYAVVLKDIGRIDEAISYFQQSLKLNPRQHAVRSNMLMTMHYSTSISAQELADEHRKWEIAYVAGKEIELTAQANPASASLPESPTSSLVHAIRDHDPDRVLRVGFVSGDFRSHSVADFFESLIQNRAVIDPDFITYGYSNFSQSDAITDRLRNQFHCWREVSSLGDANLIKRIKDDQIDILVDLSGHSALNRMAVFVEKPAPIQITWLGYPNTTGLSAMDYRITDAWADPPGMTEAYFSEKLWRLPRGFLSYRVTPGCPDVSEAPCRSREEITFGSFNHFAKLNLSLIRRWARILERVPSSTLLLKATVLGRDFAQRAMRNYFDQAGLDPARVRLLGAEKDFYAHIAWYREVDIGLDTFPYHGTTTTCEALWMGVPVVSLAGRTHCSRVGVSLLNSIGLSMLVASTEDEYIEKAVELASDRNQLNELRGSMRSRLLASPLLDSQQFTREFFAALRSMWCDHCKSGR